MGEYSKRDIEGLGDFYVRHIQAMTSEGLHSKSDIAAELAWRDAEIERLREELRKIASGTPDADAPYRAMGVKQMKEIAQEALEKGDD